jgi:hypothetical protein
MITRAIAIPAIVVIREYCFFLYQSFEMTQTSYLVKGNRVKIAVADDRQSRSITDTGLNRSLGYKVY